MNAIPHVSLQANGTRWRVIAGACAIGLGLGFARFDFAVLAREMVSAGWLHSGGIARLGGVNTLGYLIGSLHHSRLRDPNQAHAMLLWAVGVIVVSLSLDAVEGSDGWDSIWRLLAGWGSGHLMAGIPSIALAGLSGHRRRQATGFVMSGAGLGAMLGALTLGATAPGAPELGGFVLAGLGILLSLPVIWLLRSPYPEFSSTAAAKPARVTASSRSTPNRDRATNALTVGYFLLGATQVPVVLYLPLIMSNRLDLTPALTSTSFSIFGIGCVAGAIGATTVPPAIPTRWLLPLASLVGLVGSVCLLLGTNLVTLNLASFLSGAWIWLMVAFTFDRLQQLARSNDLRREWAWLTSLLGMGFMLFSLLCSPLAVDHLPVVLAISTTLAAVHVLMELIQARSS